MPRVLNSEQQSDIAVMENARFPPPTRQVHRPCQLVHDIAGDRQRARKCQASRAIEPCDRGSSLDFVDCAFASKERLEDDKKKVSLQSVSIQAASQL